jgi:hypothetical protein
MFHFFWNFFEGSVYGVAVSGVSVPSVFFSEISGPEIISGGAFGAEGSIAVTLLGIALVAGLALRKPAKDLEWQMQGGIGPRL